MVAGRGRGQPCSCRSCAERHTSAVHARLVRAAVCLHLVTSASSSVLRSPSFEHRNQRLDAARAIMQQVGPSHAVRSNRVDEVRSFGQQGGICTRGELGQQGLVRRWRRRCCAATPSAAMCARAVALQQVGLDPRCKHAPALHARRGARQPPSQRLQQARPDACSRPCIPRTSPQRGDQLPIVQRREQLPSVLVSGRRRSRR
mmetsp:Transcript_33534/g.99843  ORF Transcript_33534/g.99843 Transcript_33534/m.99843 type:complete len:202 (-) Transcript_33534:158-763(-)